MNRFEQSGEENGRGRQVWTWIQHTLLIAGIGLLTLVGVARLESWVGAQAALRAFDAAAGSPVVIGKDAAGRGNLGEQSAAGPATARATPEDSGATLAVLEIPSIGLMAPVFDGSDPLTLHHGVGRIPGTATPGLGGNIALAGHRDTYFRGLKNIRQGDLIRLRTYGGVDTYVVNLRKVVRPEDVSVLKATEDASITLVTCYPFDFLGRAPMRFVVTAHRMRHSTVGLRATDTRSIPQPSNSTQEEP